VRVIGWYPIPPPCVKLEDAGKRQYGGGCGNAVVQSTGGCCWCEGLSGGVGKFKSREVKGGMAFVKTTGGGWLLPRRWYETRYGKKAPLTACEWDPRGRIRNILGESDYGVCTIRKLFSA
jgi:hypothetical protein